MCLIVLRGFKCRLFRVFQGFVVKGFGLSEFAIPACHYGYSVKCLSLHCDVFSEHLYNAVKKRRCPRGPKP